MVCASVQIVEAPTSLTQGEHESNGAIMNLTPIARSSSRTLTSLLIQFAEMPEDFANTVEYSVLVAQTAVYQVPNSRFEALLKALK